jgi:putative heme degradation protein
MIEQMDVRDPYVAVDDVLMPWAKTHGFEVGTQHRDDIVRSIWFYDQMGNQRAQMWLGIPNILNAVNVFAAEFRPDLPRKWGERLERHVALSDLHAALDEFSAAALRWAGPGAFT